MLDVVCSGCCPSGDLEFSGHSCPQPVSSHFDLELHASPNLGLEVWALRHSRSLRDSSIRSCMFSKSSRKPCQVDVKIDPNLDFEVGVVKAFLGVKVEGGVDDDVTIEDPPGIEVSGVDVHLGVGVDGDIDVGGDIDVDVVVWDVLEVHLCVDGCVDVDFAIGDPPDVDGDIDVDVVVWDVPEVHLSEEVSGL